MHQDKENFNVSWHNYPENLRDMLKDMISDDSFADVTLVTDDKKQLKAHRNILSACSSVFKEILQINTNNNHPVIYLRGIQHSEMMSVLQLIYLGEAKCYKERMKEFLTVAKILDIQVLAEGNEEDQSAAEYEEDEFIKKEESPIPVEDVEPGQLDIDGAADSQNKTNSRAVIEGGHDYKCKLCAKTYNTSFILKRHIQSVHVGVKYACNLWPERGEENPGSSLRFPGLGPLTHITQPSGLTN